MLTKRQYALSVCRKWAHENNRDCADLESMVGDIYASTTLGIALEILDVISPSKHINEYNYLANRGGQVAMYVDEATAEAYILTAREFYDLLPDNLG